MFLGITCSVIIALIILFRFGWFDRFVYALIQILLAILIIGRIACEKTTCFWEMVKWYFAQLSIIKYVPCKEKDCEADWSLRGGIDEAGLILTGVFFFVTVLFVKNKTQLNLILMIDCSTSMKDELKLEKSKEAAINFLQRINSLDNLICKVVLYRISSEQQGFVAAKWFDSSDLELYQQIQNLQIAGVTPLFRSLLHTLDLASRVQQGNTMIICLTDGESTEEDLSVNNVLEPIKNTQVPIISIGFGKEAYTAMIQISELSGAGKSGAGYFIGVEPNEINRIFEDISDSIACSYRISWMPGFENQNEVNLKLRVMYRDGEGIVHQDVYEIVHIGRDETMN